jgi:poly(3-hydroxybutyrate) depolymerase
MTDSDRTADERAFINWLADEYGEEWADEHAGISIAQAKRLGELDGFAERNGDRGEGYLD